MKKLLTEFRNFIMTGNVIDLSVAVLLATAVGAVVSEFTQNIMMPIVGQFTGGMDFSDLKIVLSEAESDASGNVISPENAILYGKWINTLINLIIVGFILFLIVKAYSRVGNLIKKKEEEDLAAAATEPEVTGPTQEEILTEILGELKRLNK